MTIATDRLASAVNTAYDIYLGFSSHQYQAQFAQFVFNRSQAIADIAFDIRAMTKDDWQEFAYSAVVFCLRAIAIPIAFAFYCWVNRRLLVAIATRMYQGIMNMSRAFVGAIYRMSDRIQALHVPTHEEMVSSLNNYFDTDIMDLSIGDIKRFEDWCDRIGVKLSTADKSKELAKAPAKSDR